MVLYEKLYSPSLVFQGNKFVTLKDQESVNQSILNFYCARAVEAAEAMSKPASRWKMKVEQA